MQAKTAGLEIDELLCSSWGICVCMYDRTRTPLIHYIILYMRRSNSILM